MCPHNPQVHSCVHGFQCFISSVTLSFRVKHDCPRLLINREKAGEGDRLMALLGMGGGMDFSDKSTRDVAWLGDCDDGCLLLADKLGWGVSIV